MYGLLLYAILLFDVEFIAYYNCLKFNTGIPAFPPFEVTQGKSTKHPTKTTSLVANNTHKKKKKPIPTNTPTPAIDLSEISTMVECKYSKT